MQKVIKEIERVAKEKKYGTIKIICTYSNGKVNKITIFDGEKVKKLNKKELYV